MPKTVTVKTFELRKQQIGRHKEPYCHSVGNVRILAETATLDIERANRAMPIPETDLDAFEKELRKDRKATLRGVTYTIVPITEEYDADEEDD